MALKGWPSDDNSNQFLIRNAITTGAGILGPLLYLNKELLTYLLCPRPIRKFWVDEGFISQMTSR